MRSILFVIADFQPSGHARLLLELLRTLPRDRVRLCVLGQPSVWSELLRRENVAVEILGRRHPFEVRTLRELRRVVRGHDGLIHAWGPGSLEALLTTLAIAPARLLVSGALPFYERCPFWLPWLLGRCGKVIALGAVEESRLRSWGLRERTLCAVMPGITPTKSTLRATCPGLSDSDNVVLVPGPIRRAKGQHEAVWVLDFLGYLFQNLHFVFTGDGPDRPRVIEFTRATNRTNRVHFTGVVDDIAPWLARSSAVFLPCTRDGGSVSALEAMAAGVPVVASQLPSLSELLGDGAGLLVPIGHMASYSRAIRQVLEQPELAKQMSEQGRRTVRERYSAEAFTKQMQQIYASS